LVPARSPVLIVIGGWPATGKTTFARQVGARLGLPVVNKDTIKELLWDRLGDGDVDWSHRLGIAAFGVLDMIATDMLRSGTDLIVEGNFHTEYGMSLQTVADDASARVLLVVVNAPPDVIVQRFRARIESGERHPAHPDEQLLPEIERMVQKPYEPPPLRARRVDVALVDLGETSAALDQVAQAYEVALPDPA